MHSYILVPVFSLACPAVLYPRSVTLSGFGLVTFLAVQLDCDDDFAAFKLSVGRYMWHDNKESVSVSAYVC